MNENGKTQTGNSRILAVLAIVLVGFLEIAAVMMDPKKKEDNLTIIVAIVGLILFILLAIATSVLWNAENPPPGDPVYAFSEKTHYNWTCIILMGCHLTTSIYGLWIQDTGRYLRMHPISLPVPVFVHRYQLHRRGCMFLRQLLTEMQHTARNCLSSRDKNCIWLSSVPSVMKRI